MIEKFLSTINEHNLIEKGDGVVVGVSGGPDSICLLHLFWTIKDEYELKLYAVHLNHQFRGLEAEKDAKYVKTFCDNLKIPSFIYTKDVSDYAHKNSMTDEEAGRELRYSCFYEIANKKNAKKIAVAQNMNDQAETVLMRLMRGAGIDGLTAIDYKRDDRIIRPLLDVERDKIEKYCEENKLNPRIDKTNQESIYTRNRVRLELIPYIEKHFNKNIKSTLCRTAKHLREDSDFINIIASEAYNEVVMETEEEVRIDCNKFKEFHSAIKNRIIRKGIRSISGELKDVESRHIQLILEFIQNGKTGTKIDLPNNISGVLEYETLILKKSVASEKQKDFEYKMPIGKKLFIDELEVSISTRVLNISEVEDHSKEKYKKYLDFHKVTKDIIIRNRRNGDSFVPLGMSGRKKLKDFFIDEKIPREKRHKIILICDGEEIMWIVGYRISNKYKIDKKTKKVLEIKYETD